MKLRIRFLCLALAACLSLAACGQQVAAPTTGATTLPTTEATTQVITETTEATEPASYSVLENAGSIQNVILIIGDGMGLQHIRAGTLYDGKEYGFTGWPMVRVNTQALDSSGALSEDYPDSVAASTAMATGVLTANEFVGRGIDGTDLPTILDLAQAMGKATGIVTNDVLFNGTPAGYASHASSRNDRIPILESQLTSGANLLCGSLHESCTIMAPQIREQGYAYCESYADLSGTFGADKAYWQLPIGGNDATLSLAEVSLDALRYLEQKENGFVLVIEQAHIDKYCHHQQFEDVCIAVSDLNKTVEAVMSWLGDRTDTAVLVTADHETGSLQVADTSGKYKETLTAADSGANQDISYEFRTPNHTTTNVALYTYGFTADFTKSDLYKKKALKNTEIYYLMAELIAAGQEE